MQEPLDVFGFSVLGLLHLAVDLGCHHIAELEAKHIFKLVVLATVDGDGGWTMKAMNINKRRRELCIEDIRIR